MIVFKASILLAFIAFVSGFDVSVDVVYPSSETEDFQLSCSGSAEEGTWIHTAAYKKFPELTEWNLMVEVTFVKNQVDECYLVPYASDDVLSARFDEMRPALQQCIGEDFDSLTTTIILPTTTTTVATTITTPPPPPTTTPPPPPTTTPPPPPTTTPPPPTTTTPPPPTTTTPPPPPSTIPPPPTTTTLPPTTPPPPTTTTPPPPPTTTPPPPTTTTPPPSPTTTPPPPPTTTPPPPPTTTPPPPPTTTPPPPTTTTPPPPTTTTIDPRTLSCAESFTRIGDSCYLTTPRAMNMADAGSFCRELGGDLAVINSAEEQEQLNGRVPTNVWIGNNDIQTEGRFEPNTGYTNWLPNEPNDFNGNEDCTVMIPTSENGWNDDDCGRQKYALCEMAPAPVAEPLYCPEGEYLFRDTCYSITSDESDFEGGKQNCAGNDASPVFISDQEEMDFIAATFTETAFIGTNDQAQEGFYVSEQGASMYSNWYPNEPNDQNDEDCIEIRHHLRFEWNDIHCSSQRKMICEKQAFNALGCPESFHQFGETSCLRVSEEVGPFSEGEGYCNSIDANLAVIDSQEEHEFAKSLLQDNTYLGYQRVARGTNNDFARLDGQQIAFSAWDSGEPNDVGTEDCVEMRKVVNYEWNDTNCNNHNKYLCKSPLVPVNAN